MKSSFLDLRHAVPTGSLWVAVVQDQDGSHFLDMATADPDREMCLKKTRCRYYPRAYGVVSVLRLDVAYQDEQIIL